LFISYITNLFYHFLSNDIWNSEPIRVAFMHLKHSRIRKKNSLIILSPLCILFLLLSLFLSLSLSQVAVSAYGAQRPVRTLHLPYGDHCLFHYLEIQIEEASSSFLRRRGSGYESRVLSGTLVDWLEDARILDQRTAQSLHYRL
jgi:hypothetical protein